MNKFPKTFENMKVVTKTCSTIWDEQRIRHSSGSEGDGIAPMGLVCSNTSAETPSGGQFMCFLFALNVHSVLKISLNAPCERVIAAIPFAFLWQPRHISQMDFWIFFISCNNCLFSQIVSCSSCNCHCHQCSMLQTMTIQFPSTTRLTLKSANNFLTFCILLSRLKHSSSENFVFQIKRFFIYFAPIDVRKLFVDVLSCY